MLVIIKKGTPLQEILNKLNSILSPKNKKKGFHAEKYLGILKANTQLDPVNYQTNMRNEWE